MNKELNQASFFKLVKNCLKHHDRRDIFLKNSPSFAYPINELESLNKEDAVKIVVNFMGLLGSGSHLTSYILEKISKSSDNNFEKFFDFFDNYLLWLFFDSISLKNYARSFEKELDDKISKILLDILNISNKKLAKKFLPFSPLIISQRRPKREIEFALQRHFNLKNKLFLLENLPNQIFIAPSNLNSLGIKNRALGRNFILGKKLFEKQTKIAVYINGIDYEEAIDFFPKRRKFKELQDTLIFFTNNEFVADLYIKINYSPKMQLKLGIDESYSKIGLGARLKSNKNMSNFIKFRLCS